MKKFLIQTLVVAIAGFSICAQAAGTKDTDLTAWERFKAYSHNEKEIAVQEGKKLIAATDRHIAELKKQAKSADKKTRAAYEAEIKTLEAKKKDAKMHLDKMAKASANSWDATKEGFANAYRDLHEGYDKAVAAAKK